MAIAHTQGLYVQPGEVISVNSASRTVDIKWLGQESGATNIPIISGSGDFSMPKVGEYGLILFADDWEYYLGKLEYNYINKIAGTTKDNQTGETVLAKEVKGGEVFLSNLSKRVWLSLTNSGDFGLLNGLNEGLKYFTKGRILRLGAMTLRIAGNGIKAGLGSTVRDLPGKGATVILEGAVPTVEAFIEVAKGGVKLARMHLGEIKDTTLGAVPDISSYGSKLRVLFQSLVGGNPVASIGLDEAGNAELVAKTGKALVDGTEVQLGGVAASEQLIKGNQYTAAENTFLIAFSTFLDWMTAYFASVPLLTPAPTIPWPASPTAINMQAQIVTMKIALEAFKSALSPALSPKVKTV